MDSPPRVGVGVGVIIEREGKVLLQRRTGSHGTGTWSCPGGHIDFGESIEACAQRETREEAGLDVGTVTFVGITNDLFPQEKKQYITVWVRAEYRGGEPTVQAQGELTDIGWFSWDALPQPLFIPLQNFLHGHRYIATPEAAVAPHTNA